MSSWAPTAGAIFVSFCCFTLSECYLCSRMPCYLFSCVVSCGRCFVLCLSLWVLARSLILLLFLLCCTSLLTFYLLRRSKQGPYYSLACATEQLCKHFGGIAGVQLSARDTGLWWCSIIRGRSSCECRSSDGHSVYTGVMVVHVCSLPARRMSTEMALFRSHSWPTL